MGMTKKDFSHPLLLLNPQSLRDSPWGTGDRIPQTPWVAMLRSRDFLVALISLCRNALLRMLTA